MVVNKIDLFFAFPFSILATLTILNGTVNVLTFIKNLVNFFVICAGMDSILGQTVF